MDPETRALLDELERRVDAKRAAGLYAIDDIREPTSDPDTPFLAEELARVGDLAEVTPNLAGVGSTRRGVGVAVGKTKSALARATSQPLIGVADQATAFNSVMVSYVAQMAQEITRLRARVAALEGAHGTSPAGD